MNLFEPLVLVTLADFIASGRIFVKHSRRYRDKWTDVPDIELGGADLDEHVSNIKSDLDNIWEEFTVYTQTEKWYQVKMLLDGIDSIEVADVRDLILSSLRESIKLEYLFRMKPYYKQYLNDGNAHDKLKKIFGINKSLYPIKQKYPK